MSKQIWNDIKKPEAKIISILEHSTSLWMCYKIAS